MNRYRTYGQLDDVPEVFGDAGFTKLDMLTDPAMLEQGVLAVSENLRFDANGTTVRKGMQLQFPAATYNSKIYGVCIFKPAADQNYLALASGQWLAIFNTTTQTFSYAIYPFGETIAEGDKVDMVQAGIGAGTLPTLFILRGASKSVLKYDANTNTVTVATGFAPGDFALFYQDRIAVANTQSVQVSDFLEFATFSQLNQFQILKGGDDYLQCFLSYQKDYVLIGTRQGWQIAFFDPHVDTAQGGYYQGLQSDTSFLRQLTKEAGPVGPKAATEAMGLIWFISGGAIYAFQPQLDNQLTVLGRPISADIQPIMDRMCVRYANRAAIERYGYRLYFALPISDVPLSVATVTVTPKTTIGITLPATLPCVLSANSSAEITTTNPHKLTADDRVLLSGSISPELNGEFDVLAVTDDYTFSIILNISSTVNAGDRLSVQKLALRNNCIAVYNLNNQGFESIDWLPEDIKADWLRPVEHNAQRRLLLVDEDKGPFLYEEGDEDEVGNVVGGVTLPVTLPVTLSSSNVVSQPISGKFLTRCYRWGVQPRKVSKSEIRATLDSASAVTITMLARTPNHRLWTGSRTFAGTDFETSDAPLRKLCGERCLETQIQITTQSGRPTFRAVSIETLTVGKVEE